MNGDDNNFVVFLGHCQHTLSTIIRCEDSDKIRKKALKVKSGVVHMLVNSMYLISCIYSKSEIDDGFPRGDLSPTGTSSQ